MIATEQNAPLNLLHTFRLPGVARVVYYLRDKQDCVQLPDIDYLVIGHGSNTIFTTDFQRPLVRVELLGIAVDESSDHWLLTVGAGENWHDFVTFCLSSGYFGLENLALIPGTVGAAPVQNIGAYGVEVAEFIDSVEAWDRHNRCFVRFTHGECQFGYRDSIFKQYPNRWLITEVHFAIPKVWRANTAYAELTHLADARPEQIYQTIITVRQYKLPDPRVIANAGSFFKNPVISAEQFAMLASKYSDIKGYVNSDGSFKVAAGWLIDNRGWKGINRGAIAVHQRQALVLVNLGNGNGDDLIALASEIKSDIQEHFGIDLEVEVRVFGQDELVQL